MVITQDIVNLVTESVKEDAKKLRGGVIFADHLPKNPQGKLLRRKLLELYEENIISNTIKVSWWTQKNFRYHHSFIMYVCKRAMCNKFIHLYIMTPCHHFQLLCRAAGSGRRGHSFCQELKQSFSIKFPWITICPSPLRFLDLPTALLYKLRCKYKH